MILGADDSTKAPGFFRPLHLGQVLGLLELGADGGEPDHLVPAGLAGLGYGYGESDLSVVLAVHGSGHHDVGYLVYLDGSGSTAAAFRSMLLPLSLAIMVWSFRRMYSVPYGRFRWEVPQQTGVSSGS